MIKLLASVLAAILAFYVYKSITKPKPTPPKLDYDYWWGPDDTKGKADNTVKPFKIEITENLKNDLKERLSKHVPFTPPLDGVGFEYGFNTNYLNKVVHYWQNDYNFTERAKFLNKYDHFKTNIQGLDIHFIHVKPKSTDDVKVYPLLLLHGWPGSIREFYEIVPLLTSKREGYDYVFELIIPSLPGYGFSQGTAKVGLCQTNIAVIMRNLMRRLSFEKYYVQGGDWGAVIGGSMATLFPEEVLGYHSNMLVHLVPPSIFKWILGAYVHPWFYDEKHPERVYPISEKLAYFIEEFGYMHLQATKPDTIGVGLTDSPVGLAAYILEKFSTWTNTNYKSAPDGRLETKFTLDQLLDNVMIYWSTKSITTSMRLYAESNSKKGRELRMDGIPTPVPTWALKTKYELFYTPDHALKLKYPNLLGSTSLDDGGHFAALEKPELLAQDIFGAVKAFIEFHKKN